jgi:phospholipid/cholesterol/gamma-HCH transport system permease protein
MLKSAKKETSLVKNIFINNTGNLLYHVGDIMLFSLQFFPKLITPPYEWSEVLKQIYKLGYKSLFLVGISSFIIGLVMTIHLIPSMRVYGVEDMIPNMAAISIIREIGPVITALVCAGKIGSAIGAEIGSMKVTEQIDAMSISGVDPYRYLVVTRVFATSLCLPLLIIYSCTIALAGAFLAENLEDQMSLSLFLTTAFKLMFFHDIIPTLVKSLFFGYTIGMVGCYYGFITEKGASGVGKSAHSSVVTSSIIIFFIDMLVVEIAHLFY